MFKIIKTNSIDYIVATPFSLDDGNYSAILKIAADLPYNVPSDGWGSCWASHTPTYITLRPGWWSITGVGAVETTEGGHTQSNILLLATGTGSIDIDVHYLRNIQITGNSIEWDEEKWKLIDLGTAPSSNHTIVSAAIGSINGNQLPDIFFLEGNGLDYGSPETERKIYGVLD